MSRLRSTAIHQPNFMPWPGYFYKILKCDTFVFLDNVDFQQGNQNSITSRTKIKFNDEEKYFSVSVKNNKESKLIKDIRIDKSSTRMDKQLKTIYHAYNKAQHFGSVYPVLENILKKYMEHEFLNDANIFAIKEICGLLEINTSMVKASDLTLQSEERNERIIEICKTLDSPVYFSGRGAKSYHDEALFKQKGITIEYTTFEQQPYQQVGNTFIPGLSVIDCLLNCGIESTKQLIKGQNEKLQQV